ncbi:MAG: glutamate-5-semialdehyde dehydrogenase [Candidatus Omnitrophota bacterium]
MNLKTELTNIAKKALDASRELLSVSSEAKNKVLLDLAEALIVEKDAILKANKIDIAHAEKAKLSRAFIDRLTLNEKRIQEMADSLRQMVSLSDPVGEEIKVWDRPNGLKIHKVRAPIGVIAIIYESRPNVTSDCAGLCLKSGNAVILRGGSESLESNLAIYKIIRKVLKRNNFSENAVNLIAIKDRKAVDVLLKLTDYIDLVIPRGGESLIRRVVGTSHIPVIKHYKGICHIYVDSKADLNMAQRVCFNAKVQRPGTCNAMETMLVNKEVAGRFLPVMIKALQDAGVQIRGCALTKQIAKNFKIKRASDKNYHTEYLDLILSVKVVKDLNEAVGHINKYGTKHSDSIITENQKNAAEFLKRVDSACVYVNASTRFTDGYQFGMGAEIGISTDKLHARGPMALEELTTYKYMVFGNGQIRE